MTSFHRLPLIIFLLLLFFSSTLAYGFIIHAHPACLPTVLADFMPKVWAKSWADPPVISTPYPADAPASPAPLLAWSKNLDAVSYQVEFFDEIPSNLSDTQLSPKHIYYAAAIYSNAFNPALEDFPEGIDTSRPLYWRVRAANLRNKPISRFSPLEPLYTDAALPQLNAPVPTAVYNEGNGQNLLYPVYSWIRNHGAEQFELEVLSELPENPEGTAPSQYRIFSTICQFGEQYDPAPRFGPKPFYWRVRGLDASGQAVGVYSPVSTFALNPADGWDVGIYGDSISHGGGHLSYGPADWEYSYASYLSFPTVNLSQSGDTSAMMLARFDRDVLPFKPHYLLILGGTNSLRGGVPAAAVIEDLQQIKEKCLTNGIKPIFLTLPPVNPANIQIAFAEDTAEDWPAQFALVNEYIRSQVHIDIAAALDCPDGVLPTHLGLDGLHLDAAAKKIMGESIDASWAEITLEADAQ